MLFQTREFLVLILVVMVGLTMLRKARHQHWILLAASYVFYGWWDVRFLFLLLISTLIDFMGALGIAGVRLELRERLRYTGVLLAGAALFLGLNWPMLQGTGGTGSARFFTAAVPNPAAIALGTIVLAVAVNVLYVVYFRLGERARRRAFLTTSMVGNLGMLGFFKYWDFFTGSLSGVGSWVGLDWQPAALDIVLPVGISFYTFQTMSYGIDVYRGKVEPERSLVRMALFVTYFPQLVAGPIIRPQDFLPHLNRPWTLQAHNVISGFHLSLVGLFKKVVIADWLAGLVDATLGHPIGQPSMVIMLGSALFAVQIYCDFSGYTDIARGVSRMFGVPIMKNFDHPYFATSIIDFWRRWHISLSTWLRDYLYIPLGGNRSGPVRTYANLMITMVLGGLWHGASWNFVLWGAYQGGLLCVNRALRGWIESVPPLARFLSGRTGTVLRWTSTMYFVLLGWVLFRVTDFEALRYAVRAFVLFDGRLELTSLGLGNGLPVIAMLAFGGFVVLHALSHFRRSWAETLDRVPQPLLPLAYASLAAALFFIWPAVDAPFIYFQF